MNYTIAQVSRRFGINASTLRYYEEIGLLTDVPRSESGHRMYTEEHIQRLESINCFKKAGMSISDIISFYEYEKDESNSIDDMMLLLRKRKEKMLGEFLEAYESYAHILKKLDYYSHVEEAVKSGKKMPKWDDFGNNDYHKEALQNILDKLR